MKRIALALAIAAAVVAYNASAALATTPGWECIPTTAGQAVVSGGTGLTPACGAGSTPVLAPTYVSSGVGGKPTVQFASVNVQIISGSGSTNGTVNGEGNLVVGYAENAHSFTRTGSNNLVVGADNGWTSSGGIIGGDGNLASGAGAVLFGEFNVASGGDSFIGGGCGNLAGGTGKPAKQKCPAKGAQAILGGHANQATAPQSSVSGGQFNASTDLFSSIAGGCANLVGPGSFLSSSACTTGAEAVLGGFEDHASGLESTVSGGALDTASGASASVLGGQGNVASGGNASIAGGDFNQASGSFNAILGGFENSTNGFDSTVSGGETNSASGNEASVLGGEGNSATINCQAIPAAPIGSC
jgi:hypothetical protein